MKLTDVEQEELLWNNEVVAEYGHGERRWMEGMTSIVKLENGKFYRINWDRGLTENQEDEFESGEVDEVFPYKQVTASINTSYLTPAEAANAKAQFVDRLQDEAEGYEIVTGEKLEAQVSVEIAELAAQLLTRLPKLHTMDIVASAGGFREATQQYLEALVALKEKK